MADTDYRAWVGRQQATPDRIRASTCEMMIGTLHSQSIDFTAGMPAPLLAHWLHFLDHGPLDQTGPDGHQRRGGFLPPVALPRRMWAGSIISFHRPLVIDAMYERRSRVASVDSKVGRSGALVFVGVDHEIHDAHGPVLSDHHDIVYRRDSVAARSNGRHVLAPTDERWSRRIDPDPVLLFRYSALTFNGHRIHYDQRYATEVEGYDGLVVHGPLIATLLLHEFTFRHPHLTVASYRFRALKPIVHTEAFTICGRASVDNETSLFARDSRGFLCMEATATVVPAITADR